MRHNFYIVVKNNNLKNDFLYVLPQVVSLREDKLLF